MNSALACPDLPELRRFLLGQGPDEEAGLIESHLSSCPDCLAAVSSLDASDELVEAAQARATMICKPAQTVRLEGLIRELKELYPSTTPFPGATEDYGRYFSPPQDKDEIGRIGQYRVRRLLGMGGMGVVFLAEDTQLQRDVALKLLRPTLFGSVQARQRFLREARAAAKVVDDHIVPIYQVGEDRDVPYLAMPVLQGESLADRLARQGRLPVDDVIHIGREIALGLAAAHARGLVHRDVKPANVWLEPTGASSQNQGAACSLRERVRLLDFGLVHVCDSQPPLTEVGIVIGTPAYMAPEQAMAGPVDARCDLFSLGTVLYTMAAGRPPFLGGNNLEILHALYSETPAPIQSLVPELPERLTALIEKLHAKDKENRCQSAQEVVEWLDACRAAAKLSPAPKPTRRAPRWSWAAAALVLLGLSGLAVVGAAHFGYLAALFSPPQVGTQAPPPPAKDDAIPAPQAKAIPTLAVLGIDEKGPGVKNLGAQVSELLFARLAAKDGLRLVDRADLHKVLKELELGASGAVKAGSAAHVGQLTGARLLLWGSILQVDKRRHLIAKLVGVETGEVVGLTVDGPSTDELGPLVAKLADKVADALAQAPERLLPKAAAKEDLVTALNKQMGKGARPALWIRVPERAVGMAVPDPAAQTELVLLAKEVGFPVVDADEGARGQAAILVTGEGLTEVGGRNSGLVTVKARVEVKAVERATGKVLAADRQVVVVVDVTEQLAGKAALQQAAAAIAARLLPRLVGKE